jgi:hypothetical protein
MKGLRSLAFALGVWSGCAGVPAPVTPAGGGAPASVTHDVQAGLAPLRRLTQEQYVNTVRDLLGITDPITGDLPIDEGAGGFYSNIIAPISELQIEKYRTAAEVLASKAAENLPALLPCDPEADEAGCAARFIAGFGRRAYRRPLAPSEDQRYRQLFAEARARSDLRGGVRVVIETMLQSIHFLYRFEPAAGVARTAVVPLPPYAMASRLSYFLWNTMPDETLFAAAAANQLSTREQVAAQAARMVADARFTDAAVSFHLQWLDVVELPGKEKRKSMHPLWGENLRIAMHEETVRFVTDVIKSGDGRLETLLAAPYTIAAGPLLTLYGPPSKQPGTKKEESKEPKSILDKARLAPEPPKLRPSELVWRRLKLDPAQRAGLLTQASVLSVHAHWDKSSLVHRGKLIREKLLCEVLPPPPPEVNNTLPPADAKRSARERFEEHRAEVSCAKCHRLIDPLGAPFEMFDAIGNYRTKDGPDPIDSEGELKGTRASDGPVQNAAELARRLSTADEVRACVARQWLRFALGREEAPDEARSLDEALDAFRASDYRIPALAVAIARTDAFRYQQVSP